MAAGLEPLRDYRVDAADFEPFRLFDRSRAAQDDCASGFDALKQAVIGQPEVEADDLGPKLLDCRAHRFIERQSQRTACRRRYSKFFIIRLEQRAPRAVVDPLWH